MLKYILVLLFITYTHPIIIINDMINKNVILEKETLIKNNAYFTESEINAGTLNIANTIIFKNSIHLEGLPFNDTLNPYEYHITINDNDEVFYSPLLLKNNVLFAVQINSIDSDTLYINNENTHNLIFNGTVFLDNHLVFNGNIVNTNDNTITIEKSAKFKNINIRGSNIIGTFLMTDKLPCNIISNVINIDFLQNTHNLLILPTNGVLNFSCFIQVPKIIVSNPESTVTLLSLMEDDTIYQYPYTNYFKNYDNIKGNNFININNTDKIIINSDTTLGINSNNIKFSQGASITSADKNGTPIIFNNLETNATEFNILEFNQESFDMEYIQASGKKTDSLDDGFVEANGNIFIFSNNNSSFGIGGHTDDAFPVETGSKLVINTDNESYQLFKMATSSEQYMENILPLEISEAAFKKALQPKNFELKNPNEMYDNLNFRDWVGTALEPMIRYNTNEEPIMYEERELTAVFFTQLPHIENKIKLLEENLKLIEKDMDLFQEHAPSIF